MATPMERSEAPKGETIDDGSFGTLGAPKAAEALDDKPAGVSAQAAATAPSQRVALDAGGVRIEIIITTGASVTPPAEATERAVRPWIDGDYDNRQGYQADFLGPQWSIPLPKVRTPSVLAPLRDGGQELRYQHFSVLMHRERRLCLLTAANVDGSPRKRRPDPSRRYGRAALGGLGPKDQELWSTDPRLAEQYQLPDRFFTKDGGAFDRGHVVMRDNVCWGNSYTEVRRANGDTYHTPNCTPQVAGFNQASKDGRWGELEEELIRRLGTERMSVLAGPVLSDEDWWFEGVDDHGPVRVQIPWRYWKVVVGLHQGKLAAFAFLLEQDLRRVPLRERDELSVDPVAWRDVLTSVAALDDLLPQLAFPDVLRDADQSTLELGKALVDELGLTRQPGV